MRGGSGCFSCGAQVLRCLCIFSAHIYFFNCFNVWHQGWVLSCRQGATPRLTPVLGIWNLCGWTNHHMLHGFFLTVYTLWLPADLQEAVAIGRICYHFNRCLLGSWFIWKLYWKETWSLTSFILTWWFSSSALFQNFLALKISRFPRLPPGDAGWFSFISTHVILKCSQDMDYSLRLLFFYPQLYSVDVIWDVNWLVY